MSDFSTVEEYLKEVVAEFRQIGKIFGASKHSGMGRYLQEIETLPEVIRSLLPAKEGDRVVLVKPVKCDGGWKGHEHFLCVGSKATIESLGISDGRMHAYLEFDNETWIDDKGKVHPVSDKHVFGFGFDYFARIHEGRRTKGSEG